MPWVLERIRVGSSWERVMKFTPVEDKMEAMDGLKGIVNDPVLKKEDWRYRLRNTVTNETISGEDFIDEHLVVNTFPTAYKRDI